MMPHSNPTDNSIAVIILGVVIQAFISFIDYVGNINFTGFYDHIYDGAKLTAICVSVWASYRVGKKNK